MDSPYQIPRDEVFEQQIEKISGQSTAIKSPAETTSTIEPDVPASPTAKSKKKRDGSSSLRKAPGAPKRFKSSYILFFMEKQKEIKAELGDKASVGEISKKSSEKWKTLSAEERSVWDLKAEADKERFYLEKEQYTGPWQVPWKRAKKNPNAPKRPMSAFLFFSQDKRRVIKGANPGMRNTEVSRVLGGMWKNASAEERAPHIEREAAEREKYKVEIAKWREEEAVRSREMAHQEKIEKIEMMNRIKNEEDDYHSHPHVHSHPHPGGPPPYHHRTPPVSDRASPIPIHHQRATTPPPSSQGYYPQGGHSDYYQPQNYSAPPHFNSYGPYQHHQPVTPQGQNYYRSYPPTPHSDYRPRSYQEYHSEYPPPAVPRIDSMDDLRHKNHLQHGPPPRAQYTPYYSTSMSGYDIDQQHQYHQQHHPQQHHTNTNYCDDYSPLP